MGKSSPKPSPRSCYNFHMAIPFNCPNCQKHYRVKDHLAEKQVKCTQCEKVITVPQAAPAPAAHEMEDFALSALGDEKGKSNGSAVHPTVAGDGKISIECPYCFETVEF